MRRTAVSIAAVVLALSMLSACTSRSSGPQVSPGPPTSTPTASISPGPGTVTVVLSGIQGEQGSHLAGVLFRADGTGWNAVGGFSVLIDSDPFSTTQVVHRGYRGWPDPSLGLAFPYVVDEVASVEPGTYTLDLWLARKLSPYGRWLPAASPGLKNCRIRVVIHQGQGAVVGLIDPALHDPRWTGTNCRTGS